MSPWHFKAALDPESNRRRLGLEWGVSQTEVFAMSVLLPVLALVLAAAPDTPPASSKTEPAAPSAPAAAAAATPAPAGPVVALETGMGTIKLELDREKAPIT